MLMIVMFAWIGLTTLAVSWGCWITAKYPTAWHHRLTFAAPELKTDTIEDTGIVLGWDSVGLY